MSAQVTLRDYIAECEVEEILNGHRATFRGTRGAFQATGGPNAWTKEMACKAAVFFYALEARRQWEEDHP